MNKFLLSLLTVTMFSSLYVFAQTNDKFVEALRNCSPYSESGIVNINGVQTNSVKQMTGWNNGKCTYKETLTFNNMDISTVCHFSKAQTDEIVSVADAYYTTLKYSNQNLDLSSTEAIQNNPVAQVISKYLQNPSVCTIQTPQ